MILQKVTKIQDLRNRKKKLREEMVLLDEKVRRVGQDLQKQGLKTYISEGSVEAPADQELGKLKKRVVFLRGIDRIMDELLVKTVKHDRQLALKRIRADIARSEKERKRRHSLYLRLREKAEAVRKEDKGFEEQRIALEVELSLIKKPTKTESLRLSELESFLKKEFLLGDDLRIKVLEAREHNKSILKQARIASSDIIYRNFEIKYSLETGQTLELELTEQKAETILRNFDKKKLAREVT